MPGILRRAAPFAVIALALAIWWLAAARSPIFPTPPEVLSGIGELAAAGTLSRHVLASLTRVAVGYGLALALAIPLGSLMGWYGGVFQAFNPMIQLLRPISPIAWIPLAILWFGVGDGSPTFLIWMASFFPVVVATTTGVHLVERRYVQAAQNFGVTGLRLFRTVVFPAALPQIITGMRLGLGVAWLVVVAAEMVAINSGLGYLIIDARNAGSRYDLVVAGMVLIGVIGFLLDVAMRRLESLDAVRWRYEHAR
jgi:NitT/TauT family transport system permease protein